MTTEAADGALSITTRTEGVWTVIAVGGEIDAATGQQLRTHLLEVIEERRAELVLDLREVTFLDSTALGILVGANKRARALGGQIRIVTDREMVRQLFKLTALDLVFAVLPTLDEALTPPS